MNLYQLYKHLPPDDRAGDPRRGVPHGCLFMVGSYWTVPTAVPLQHLGDVDAAAISDDRAASVAAARGVTKLPPIEIAAWTNGDTYIIDGNHRLEDARENEDATIEVVFTFPEGVQENVPRLIAKLESHGSFVVRPQTDLEDEEFGEDSKIAETPRAYACISDDTGDVTIHIFGVKDGVPRRSGAGRELMSLIKDQYPNKRIVASSVEDGGNEHAERAKSFWLSMKRMGLVDDIIWV